MRALGKASTPGGRNAAAAEAGPKRQQGPAASALAGWQSRMPKHRGIASQALNTWGLLDAAAPTSDAAVKHPADSTSFAPRP